MKKHDFRVCDCKACDLRFLEAVVNQTPAEFNRAQLEAQEREWAAGKEGRQ